MKFSKELQELADKRYVHRYIAYKDLKKAIKLITGADTSSCTIRDVTSNFGNIPALAGASYRPPEARFQDLLNHELEKINKFSTLTLASIRDSIWQICRDLSNPRGYGGSVPKETLASAEAALDEQARELVFLESYRRLNFIGFRKITKKYDKHNRSQAAAWYMARVVKEKFMTADFSNPFALLSDAYCIWRNGTSTAPSSPSKQEPTGQTKYLVSEDVLMSVKLAILKSAPLQCASSAKSEGQIQDPTNQPRCGAVPISTIYFDSSGLDYYGAIVCEDKKAKGTVPLLACQWYAQGAADFYVFELIESRRSPSSRQVALSYEDTADLLAGKRDWENIKQKIPSLNPDLDITLERVATRELLPLFKSSRERWSFGKTNDVSLSVDENVVYVGALGDRATDEEAMSWISSHSLNDAETVPFPYGILNVLEVPGHPLCEFIKSDIAGFASVTTVLGYSDFLNGTAYLYQERLASLPHWTRFTKKDKERKKGGSQDGNELYEARNNSYEIRDDRHGSGTGSAVSYPVTTTNRVDVLYTGARSRWLHEQEADVQDMVSSDYDGMEGRRSLRLLSQAEGGSLRQTNSSQFNGGPTILRDLSEPLLAQATVVEASPSVSMSRRSGNTRYTTLPDLGGVYRNEEDERPPPERSWYNRFGSFLRRGARNAPIVQEPITASVRVEPKTFFANERTLLQWMNTAVLLSTISITLLHFGPNSARLGGLIMGPVAIFFLIYAFWVYLRRSYSLERKEPINYNDRLGPAILVVTLVLSLTAVMGLNIYYGEAEDS